MNTKKDRNFDDNLDNSYATLNPEHYKNTIESLNQNGGFYIGKYEAGIDIARTSK